MLTVTSDVAACEVLAAVIDIEPEEEALACFAVTATGAAGMLAGAGTAGAATADAADKPVSEPAMEA
jgi:hypothetical protein